MFGLIPVALGRSEFVRGCTRLRHPLGRSCLACCRSVAIEVQGLGGMEPDGLTSAKTSSKMSRKLTAISRLQAMPQTPHLTP